MLVFECLFVCLRGWLFVSLLSCVFGSSVYWLFVCELIVCSFVCLLHLLFICLVVRLVVLVD